MSGAAERLREPLAGSDDPRLKDTSARNSFLVLGVLAVVDPYRRTAGYVADITAATEAPLLRMIEETHPHVS